MDQISIRFKKLQTDIIKRYTSTCIEYKDDTFLSEVNSMVTTKIDLTHVDQDNENKSLNTDDENVEKSSNAYNEVNYLKKVFSF